MKQKVINLYGGPGTGKSTTAAMLFAKMKLAGFNCEYVPEFAKDLNAAVNILKKGLQDLYDFTSAELTEVVRRNSNESERGEDVRLKMDLLHPLVATSLKRLTDFYKFV